MRSYHNQPIGTAPRARHLRREAPEPERRLLRALKEAFPDQKWRHQVPMGPFYADILCFSERLVIEVDGETHVNAAAYDDRRAQFLKNEGYRVIRFNNHDVMQNLDGVTASIASILPSPVRASRSLPLPPGEGRVGTAGEG